jgi:hypothetical protein
MAVDGRSYRSRSHIDLSTNLTDIGRLDHQQETDWINLPASEPIRSFFGESNVPKK